jgi:hypothetical protein
LHFPAEIDDLLDIEDGGKLDGTWEVGWPSEEVDEASRKETDQALKKIME